MTDQPKPITIELGGQALVDLEAIRPLLQAKWDRVPEPAATATPAHVLSYGAGNAALGYRGDGCEPARERDASGPRVG